MSFAATVSRPSPRPTRTQALWGVVCVVLLLHGLLVWGPVNLLRLHRTLKPLGQPSGTIQVVSLAHESAPAAAAPSPVELGPDATQPPSPQVAAPTPTQAPTAPQPTARGRPTGYSGEGESVPVDTDERPYTMPPPPPPPTEPALPPPADAPQIQPAPPARVPGLAPGIRTVRPRTPTPEPMDPPPQYRVELPAATTLHYQIHRKGLTADARLIWNVQSEGFVLSMQGGVVGYTPRDWVSVGELDPAGLAPQRMIERMQGRAVAAVNFQRDKNLISFSGPSSTAPLYPGAQDRVSWIMQLAGVAQAHQPALKLNDTLFFQVAGPRGHVELWRFQVVERGLVLLDDGRKLLGLALVREAQRPYDTHIRVWLAIEHQHLPVRLVWESVPSGETERWELSGPLEASGL